MKLTPDKRRLQEIREVYRTLGIEHEKVRNYLVSLSAPPTEPKQPIIFIECGNTSESCGEFENARLEPNPNGWEISVLLDRG